MSYSPSVEELAQMQITIQRVHNAVFDRNEDALLEALNEASFYPHALGAIGGYYRNLDTQEEDFLWIMFTLARYVGNEELLCKFWIGRWQLYLKDHEGDNSLLR